jgi:hypothetical protein
MTILLGIHLLAWSQVKNFSWPDGKKAAISLTFDDARQSHPDIGTQLFRELDVDVTYYVLPGPVRDRLQDWKEIVEEGHEIGNHTIYHPCTGNFPWSRDKALEHYTLQTIREELLAASAELTELLGVEPVSFAYTCGNAYVGRGKSHMSYVPVVAELFATGRGWLNEALNDPEFADMALLQGIEMDGKDFTDIKDLVDRAVETGSWLVLAGHEIGEEGFQTTRTRMLRELVAYANRPESGIWISTVGEVASYINDQRDVIRQRLKAGLTFCATFDHGTVAEVADGDGRLYAAQSYDQSKTEASAILPNEITLAKEQGYYGGALEFKRKATPVIFYQSDQNIKYSSENWNGTISLWLSLDPSLDLAPGYTDPIQITDSGYDDAALWVDFSDKNPRSFRMGIFGDVSVWNPDKIGPDQNPAFIERLVTADEPPFGRGRWTHVVICFENLNTEEGKASLYVNGKPQGHTKISEPFSWDLYKSKIYLGLNYVGLLDEVAIFSGSLTDIEIESLYRMPGGINALLD